MASLEEAPAGVAAVGHRVVHGGERFREPLLTDERVLAALEAVSELAPLHNAAALTAIEAARQALPDRPHVAVFDTAFHATLPEEAATYPLPARWRELGLRRYGFQQSTSTRSTTLILEIHAEKWCVVSTFSRT